MPVEEVKAMPQQRMPVWLVTDLFVIVVSLAIISAVVWITP
jgi:hypothetical protein